MYVTQAEERHAGELAELGVKPDGQLVPGADRAHRHQLVQRRRHAVPTGGRARGPPPPPHGHVVRVAVGGQPETGQPRAGAAQVLHRDLAGQDTVM